MCESVRERETVRKKGVYYVYVCVYTRKRALLYVVCVSLRERESE